MNRKDLAPEYQPLGQKIEKPKPERKDYPAPGTDPDYFIYVGKDGKWYTSIPFNEAAK
jgi:hypothetical protein